MMTKNRSRNLFDAEKLHLKIRLGHLIYIKQQILTPFSIYLIVILQSRAIIPFLDWQRGLACLQPKQHFKPFPFKGLNNLQFGTILRVFLTIKWPIIQDLFEHFSSNFHRRIGYTYLLIHVTEIAMLNLCHLCEK